MASVGARPVIAPRGEPLGTVMAAATAPGEREKLAMLAPFRPVPLEGLSGSRGFSRETAGLGGGHWQVTFRGGS